MGQSNLDRKDWVCTQPFHFSEIFDDKMYMCCPNWLPVDLGNPTNIKENWNSDQAEKVRNSILDGSYKYCIESRCPKLTGLKQGKTGGFVHKSEFVVDNTLKSVKFNFDRSCNLKCPSCRKDFIIYEGDERTKTEKLLNEIEVQLGSDLEHIECTGSGDPFFSRTFRKWMMNFNPKMYPKLTSIHLHTNATLWNRSNWERMTNIHKLVKSCEISIDAATKSTYENKTRIGGNWDSVSSNLEYISTLPYLETIHLSFVVQEDNFTEMYDFYKLAEKLFKHTGKNWKVFYNRVVNWGTFTDEEFSKVDIASPDHLRSTEFSEEYRRLPVNHHILHNLPVESQVNVKPL